MGKKKDEGNNIGIFLLLAIIAIPLIPALIYWIILNKVIKKMDRNIGGCGIAKFMRLLILLCALAGSASTIYLVFLSLNGDTAPELFSIFPTYIPYIDITINPLLAPFIWCYAISIIPLVFFIVACSSNLRQQRIEDAFINDFRNLLINGVGGTENIESLKERIARERISPEAVRTAFIQAMTSMVLEILAIGNSLSSSLVETIHRFTIASETFNLVDDRPVSQEVQQDSEQTIESCKDVLSRLMSYFKQLAGEELAPECPTEAVLKSNEICYFTEECLLYENRKSNVSVGIALNLNAFIPGNIESDPRLYLGKQIPYEDLAYMDIGTIVITDKRMLFIGPSVSRSFKLSEIISISAGMTGVQICREDKARPEVFGFSDLFHTQLFITILRNVIQQS